jgi:hypothetical protein
MDRYIAIVSYRFTGWALEGAMLHVLPARTYEPVARQSRGRKD